MATRIQQRLRDEIASLEPQRGRAKPPLQAVADAGEEAAPLDADPSLRLARHLYALRRLRDERFGVELFSEPGWDLLLYLYIAACENGPVCISDACNGAAAPPTTALRWIRQLEEARLVVREGDPCDARRAYVRLSARAFRKMRSLLKGGCPSSAP